MKKCFYRDFKSDIARNAGHSGKDEVKSSCRLGELLRTVRICSLHGTRVSSARNTGFISTKQKFHREKIKIPLAENKSSTSMKQKFSLEKAVVLSREINWYGMMFTFL